MPRLFVRFLAGDGLGNYRRVIRNSLICLSILFSPVTQGTKYFAIDGGFHANNIAQRLQAAPGYAGDVSTLTGMFRARRAASIRGGKFGFEPALLLLFPWRSGRDGFEKTFTFQLDLALTYDLFRFLTLRAGPGIEYLLQVTASENVTLNNGGSNKTSVFYVPGGVSNAFLFTAQLGFELKLSSRFSFNADIWVTNMGSNRRRRYQGALSVGYRL